MYPIDGCFVAIPSPTEFVLRIVFLVYVWFVHPWLLDILVQARVHSLTYPLLGMGNVLVHALEPLGVWLKTPAVRERIRRWPSQSFFAQFGVGVSQLTHIFLSMMVFLHVMPLFGIDGMCFDYETRLVPCLLTNLAFILILGKEMLTFFLVLEMQKPAKALDLDAPGLKLRELLGEPILLAFGMLMFTLSWSAIMVFLEPVTAESWWGSLLSSLILFMMLYPPLRLVFLVEEWLVRQTLFNRVLIVVFFLLTMLAALKEVPGLL
ncbi:MAG: hypothetical protein ACNA70_02770 [Brevefilum sp.]